MATNDRVGNVYLDVLPRGAGFDQGVQAIINKAERDAKFLVDANTGPAQQAVNQLSNNIRNNVGGAWADAALKAAAFTAAIYGARAAVEGVINKFAELFDGLSKAEAGFNSILGEKGGTTLLSQVRQFAIDSPFVTGELVRYSQQLLGVGKAANTIVPTLQNVGDIVASVGGDTSNLGSILYALTQIQTVGRLTGQDALQLQNQLVPITKYIAEYTGKSVADVKKLQEAGSITSDVVFAAIEMQGKKVEGALNDSVRTIAGARSVLNDTLLATFQDNEGLKGIYDDLVQGIQSIAAALADPSIQTSINNAIDSVVGVYEALKPVIEGFLGFGAETGLSGLKSLTILLEGFSSVVSAIPEPALQAIGQIFATLAVLKAPLALISYAQNIARVSTGLIGPGGMVNALTRGKAALDQVTTSTNANTLATNRAAQAQTNLSASMQLTIAEGQLLANKIDQIATKQSLLTRAKGAVGRNAGLAGIVGAGFLGSQLQGGDAGNTSAQAAGGALTYGAIGLSVAGPYGAAVGAAFGAVTGYINAAEARLEKQVERNRELGKRAAEAYLKANEEAFSAGDAASLTKLQGDIKATEKAQRDAIAAVEKKYTPEGVYEDFNGARPQLPSGTQSGNVAAAVAQTEEQLAAQKAAYDKYIQPLYEAANAARALGAGAGLFNELGPGQLGPQSVKTLEELELAYRKYGVTLADVATMGKDAFAKLADQIDNLNSVQQRAVVSANLLALAIKTAAGDSATIYDNQIANIGSQVSAINALESAKAAAAKVGAPGQTLAEQDVAGLQAQSATLTAERIARTEAIARSVIATDEAIFEAKKAGNTELAKTLKLGKDEAATAAGVAAAEAVRAAAYTAGTNALSLRNQTQEAANRLAAEAANLADLQARSGALSSLIGARGSAANAALRPQDEATQLAASIALATAQTAAADAAALAATASLKEQRRILIQDGIAVDGQIIQSLDSQIRVTDEIARTTANARVLADVEQSTALARRSYNAEFEMFLTNLRRGQEESAIIFGQESAVAQARAAAFGPIESAGSAAVSVFTDTATAAERAALEVAALTAKTSQYNIAIAEGANETAARASADAAYAAALQASTVNIDSIVSSIQGMNGALASVDGKQAIITVVIKGVTEALAEIARLDTLIASGVDVGSNTAARAQQQAILDSYTGGSGPAGTSAAAQALIQDQLDAAAKAAAEKAQAEAERLQKEAEAEAKRFLQSVETATEGLTNRLQAASDAIVTAAQAWVNSIKERTQYEQAVSVGRLTRNATRQGADLTEITAGLASLRARGVSQAVLDSLGIDSVADTKQVRKLVGSSDQDLAALSAAIAARDALATTLATSEEQAAQRKNITQAIVDAASTLGFDTTKPQAEQLANTFNITSEMNSEAVALAILGVLSGGKIGT